jgi:hypothetical protein
MKFINPRLMAGHRRLDCRFVFEEPKRVSIDGKIVQYKKWDAMNRHEQSKTKYAVAFDHLPLMIFGRIK